MRRIIRLNGVSLKPLCAVDLNVFPAGHPGSLKPPSGYSRSAFFVLHLSNKFQAFEIKVTSEVFGLQ